MEPCWCLEFCTHPSCSRTLTLASAQHFVYDRHAAAEGQCQSGALPSTLSHWPFYAHALWRAPAHSPNTRLRADSGERRKRGQDGVHAGDRGRAEEGRCRVCQRRDQARAHVPSHGRHRLTYYHSSWFVASIVNTALASDCSWRHQEGKEEKEEEQMKRKEKCKTVLRITRKRISMRVARLWPF
jgi:hypothetical protein